MDLLSLMNGYYCIMPLGWFEELEHLREEQKPRNSTEIRPTIDNTEMSYQIVPEPVPSDDRTSEDRERPEISDIIIIDMNEIPGYKPNS